ncbi:MAG: diadenylate cyclase CdaA [Clostridia bacterium]|nr:diadenylate cyclase CdaA [Clostridia bacterium]
MCAIAFGTDTLSDFLNALGTGLRNFRFTDAIDVIIIAFILFWLVNFFRKLGATQLIRGLLLVLVAAYMVSNIFELTMLSWLFDKLLVSGFIFIAVLFQPELRRALDHLGRQRKNFSQEESSAFEELSKALKNLAKRSVGALVLIERSESLQDIIDTGVHIDALVAPELIENIFEDKTPLHDGALIIRNGRIEAASCIIPLMNKLQNVPQQFGTRHRAAVSATLKSDCIAIIVSEETGRISYAKEGILHSGIDSVQLANLFKSMIEESSAENQQKTFFKKILNKFRKEDKDEQKK